MSITGAPPAYHWNWSEPTAGTDNGTGTSITDLAPGTYSVTVTAQDGTGCSKEFEVVINENPVISLAATTIVDAICYGTATGSITLSPSGGTPGYSYFWTGGITTQNRSGLTAGTYNVTVTDSRGCTATAAPAVGQEDEITVTPVVTDVLCNGANNGSIAITASGGTAPYTYIWSDGSALEDRTGLGPNTYAVTVTDANGCTDVTSGLVVAQPLALTASAIASEILCNGNNSTITVTAGGGTTPYQYKLNSGAYQGSDEFIVPASGSDYIITVKDNNNCTKTTTVSVSQPPPLVLSTALTPETCTGDSDGAIDLSVSGGTGPYTYYWTKNGGGTPYAATQDLTGQTQGTYAVTVTDFKNCTANTSVVIPVANPEPNDPGTIQH